MSAAEDTIASLRNNGSEIIAVGAVMASLAIVSVVLRLLAKAWNEKEYGIDDILIGLALLWYLLTESLVLRAVDVGRQATNGASSEYVTFLKLTWVYSFLYWWSVSFATLSILTLYRRVFSTHRLFSVASLILIVLTVAWWISGTLTDIFSYRPAQAYWDSSVKGQYYINYNDFWLTSMVAELLIETATLLLPVREVMKLNLSTRKRVFIAGMFCMGGFVLITGIVRIYYAWNKSDMTPGTIWLSVHSSVAIISACLPTYRPLLARISGGRLVTMISTRRGSHSNTYLTSKGRKPSTVITKRNTPTAALNIAAADNDSRSSYDTSMLVHPEAAKLSHESDSNVAENSDKGIELDMIDGNESKSGITRKLSIPSPTSTEGGWGPLMDKDVPTRVPRHFVGDTQGPPTKRADFEYEPPSSQLPSTGLATD